MRECGLPTQPTRPQDEYRVQICRCRSCGMAVRGRHPDVAPDQTVAQRVGRRVMAAAHVLHYGVGVPVRKGPRCAQSADWCGAEPGGDQPRRCDVPMQWGMPTIRRGSVRASPLVHSRRYGMASGRHLLF